MTEAWLSEDVLQKGDEYFDALVSAINSARRSIEMEVFIFSPDEVGKRVASALEAAARRGVRVRLCVDGFGSWRFESEFGKRILEAGVRYRIYHPLPWQSQSVSVASSLARFNRRNHRKCCIIDHRVAFVGSLNLSAHHSEKLSGKDAWRDLAVRLTGPPVLWLRASFEAVWLRKHRARHWRQIAEQAYRVGHGRSGRDLVEINMTRDSRKRTSRRFVAAIRGARTRVWLVSPYFVPAPFVSQALAAAARRGIDVRVVVSSRSDMPFMPLVARSFFGYLLRAGVRIYENERVLVHAKIGLIDDHLSMGSMNLNQRTLLHDLELNVVLRKPESLAAVVARVEEEMRLAPEVRLEQWKMRSWLERLAAFFLGAFKRWI